MGDRLLSQPLDEIAIDICILEWISLFQMAKCILYHRYIWASLKSLHAYLSVEKYLSHHSFPFSFFSVPLIFYFLSIIRSRFTLERELFTYSNQLVSSTKYIYIVHIWHYLRYSESYGIKRNRSIRYCFT